MTADQTGALGAQVSRYHQEGFGAPISVISPEIEAGPSPQAAAVSSARMSATRVPALRPD